MIRGGIADKLGNRYEAKWLVRSLIDVIADKAKWLKFEGIETEYQGFEFAVAREKITEWHQTKINSPSGNWTINALKKEGVLKAFSDRLSADKNAHCYFVSQDNAKDFRTITEKARISNSYDQFLQKLSEEQKISFQQLIKEWPKPNEIVFDWLNRSYVTTIPEKELESLIESYGDLYFQNGGKSAFPNLRDILENHFNKTLTVVAILSAIRSHGVLKWKEWTFDPSIQQRLIEETKSYLQTYTPFGVGGETISRDQTGTLLDEILNSNNIELVLLTGVAGSGKSGIVRCVIEKLREHNVPHLAFRIDQFLSCSTKEELGKKLTGREESPVSTLRGSFPTIPSVLFIDQVDAVSEVSGRDGQVKEVLFKIITDAHNFGRVKVVVVCRSFDLDSDYRLKNLKEGNRTKTIDVPLLDWKRDIEPILKNKGFNVSSLIEAQRQLLCLPINLAVFLEIDDSEFAFHSMSNLHEKLIDKKQRTISNKRKTTWSLIQPLSAMCLWMSQRQKLNSPVSVLDIYPNAVDILTSEGLIILNRSQVNFFHESFFDHIYARSFVSHDQTIVELLSETEQHFFRRTQVRQILEALRQNDMNRYLSELLSVLSNNDIRFHIKAAICQWLSSIDKPSEMEFRIISRFNEPSGKFNLFFRSAVLSTYKWFDLLNEKNWIKQQIDSNNEERVEELLSWLSIIAGDRPVEVANLLRNWWNENAKRTERLLNWFGFVRRNKPDDDLLQLCVDIINSPPINLFKNQGHNPIMMLMHTWGEKSPEHCGPLLHSLFNAWFALNPGRNPFERDEIKAIDLDSFAEIAKKGPQAFLQGTTDALIRSIDMVVKDGNEGRNQYSFNLRTHSGHRFGFDDFLENYRTALKKIVQEAPEAAIRYLEKLDPNIHSCFMHLHLEAIQANPAFLGRRLPALVTDKMVFDAGWREAECLSFAHACREAIPHLSMEERKNLEQAIINYTPEIDFASQIFKEIKRSGEEGSYWTKKSIIAQLNRSGYKQWCILETIGEGLLNPYARSKLLELRRKFPNKEIKKPNNMGVNSVDSPINRERCARMKDNHWLSAINRYDNNENSRNGLDFINGAARQLAFELQEATKKDPARFSDLSLKIPDTAHHAYVKNIIRGLAETIAPSDESSLRNAVKHAHNHPEKPFGLDIVRLLEKHPHLAADTEILEILIWYASNGKANESNAIDIIPAERKTITIDTLIQHNESIHTHGMNCSRGSAWEALGSVLWKVPEVEKRIWAAVETALKKEYLISVRCCIMKPLMPLFNMNKERFSDSIRKLIILPDGALHQYDALRLSPLVTYTGIHMFPYIFRSLPELAKELCTKLFECGDETKELIGVWLVFCESFRNNLYIDKADKLASVSLDHRRLLAGVAGDAINWTENRHRAEALLIEFFFDEDAQVRNNAAEAFRSVQAKDVELYKRLAAKFLQSPAFANNGYALLHMLENATCDVLDLVIEATKQVIIDITKNGDRHGRRGTDVHQLQKLLKLEYTSSESDTEARKKILDMIDLMLFHEIYGVDSIVTAHDRW